MLCDSASILCSSEVLIAMLPSSDADMRELEKFLSGAFTRGELTILANDPEFQNAVARFDGTPTGLTELTKTGLDLLLRSKCPRSPGAG